MNTGISVADKYTPSYEIKLFQNCIRISGGGKLVWRKYTPTLVLNMLGMILEVLKREPGVWGKLSLVYEWEMPQHHPSLLYLHYWQDLIRQSSTETVSSSPQFLTFITAANSWHLSLFALCENLLFN